MVVVVLTVSLHAASSLQRTSIAQIVKANHADTSLYETIYIQLQKSKMN